MLVLPPDFEQSIRPQLEHEWEDFIAALQTASPTSIHFNQAKPGLKMEGREVPWNSSGIYLEERPSFTLDPHFHAGRYYVQEAGSMFISYLLQAIQKETTINTALDLCAAPGGKTTLLLNHLPENCLVVANEVIKSRYNILRENLAKWGRSNIISTQADSQAFQHFEGLFDLILVDAPCSGEGLFRKTPEAIVEWSLDNVQLCESRQKRILANILPAIKENGILIYSTCTYNQQENDENVAWLMQQADLEVFPIKVPEEWNILATQYGFQFYPHRTHSEGFFVSILRKKRAAKVKKKDPALKYYQVLAKKEQTLLNTWIDNLDTFTVLQNPKKELFLFPKSGMPLLRQLLQHLPRVTPGTPLGMIKGKDLVPTHELALSIHLSSQIQRLEAPIEETLAFLRKATLDKRPDLNKGWFLWTYDQYGLGWIKVLPNRINNYLPKQLRIRM